jgi:hypothetical protein
VYHEQIMRLRAPARRRGEHFDIAAGGFRRVEWLVFEIVAHKGDHIVCRAGIEQFQRQRQIGREGAAAPGVERVAVAGDETDLGLLRGRQRRQLDTDCGSSIPISAAISRINSASPPDEVMTASRRPAGRCAVWNAASVSASSTMSATSCERTFQRSPRRREEPCGFAAALGRRKGVAHNSTGPTSVSIDL